jgi:hypothetical protein
MASREKELLDRIRQLEEQNSALQDKLDMIWAVLAPDYEEPDEIGDDGGYEGDDAGPRLVQIDAPGTKKPS